MVWTCGKSICGLVVLIDTNTYSYKRQEFQNILEISLCNCFGQLLLIYLKNVEHGNGHVLDSPYVVCIH